MTAQTITEIKQVIDAIEQSLSRFVVRDHAESKFGEEQEYTAESLKSGLKETLTEIRTLVRAPAKFVRMSSHAERRAMHSTLSQMQNQLAANDYNAVATTWDTLKHMVRPYGLHATPELMETLKERMDALQDAFVPLEEKRDEVEQIRSHMEKTREKAESEEKRLSTASGKLTDLEQKVNQADQIQQRAQNSGAAIDKLHAQAKSREGDLSTFSASVHAGKVQLVVQKQKTTEYEDKLDKHDEKHQEYLNKAEKLIKAAEEALGLKTTEGISAAFTARYREERGKWLSNSFWLAMSTAFTVGSASLGYFLLMHPQASVGSFTLTSVLSKIAVVSVPIYAAWFCAAQYVRSKNTADDYGYKSVLAQSMLAFRAQFESSDQKEEYMREVLKQIHQDPLRKKHDIETPFTKALEVIFNRENTQKRQNHE